MKLQSIQIDGFWGYRERVRVNIEGLPLLVAVGHNGSGKSALVVSAVLAGLYGKFPTRTVEESITVGAGAGTIVIEFTVGGSEYRVSRTNQRSGGTSASVHRLVDGEWEALTEKGAREANAKVIELLGMGYETAVMTWVAQQGKYGLFASAQPADRFKMLASVFNLGKYSGMHSAAQERLRDAKKRVDVAQGRVSELNDNLVEDDARDSGPLSDQTLALAGEAAHAAFDEASAALAAHEQKSPHLAVSRARTALAAVKDVRLERLRASEEALSALRTARDREPTRRDEAIAAAEARFTREENALDARLSRERDESSARRQTAEAELGRISAVAAERPALDETLAAAEAAAREANVASNARAAAATEREISLREAERELELARTRIAEAQDALEALAHAGDCYACGQYISEDAAATLRTTQEFAVIALERAAASALADRDRAEQQVTQGRTADAHAVVADGETHAALTRARFAVEDAERTIQRAARVQGDLDRELEWQRKAADEGAVSRARLAADFESAVAAAEKEYEANITDITQRGQSTAAVVNDARKPTSEEAQLEEALARTESEANDSRYAAETERLTGHRESARGEATTFDAEIGRRAEVARRQAEQGTRIQAAKKELSDATEDVTVHTDLVAAYAPSGIPSMVLESVIGDLNNAINVTLAELSGGDLEVRLATSRETAAGTSETKVTVYVDTPTGARSYEALSGGQRFRVDLAIRTGLAAIVAAGTGTPIETFILDEGWGSLDEAGIRSTLEVLGRLSEQANVLTVSHIDSVRDSFPARIEVTTDEGTAAAVVIR